MIFFNKPDRNTIDEFLLVQKETPLSYVGLGLTRNKTAPKNYKTLQTRLQIGHGLDDFLKAKVMLNQWKMFEIDWVELYHQMGALEHTEDLQSVGILVNVLGLWMLNAAQLIYSFEEENQMGELYTGFAYGTLQDHAESGEERFTIELLKDESVWYELFSFSKPNWKIAKLGSFYVRYLQKKFAQHSVLTMKSFMQN